MTEQIAELPDGRRICWRAEGEGAPLLAIMGLGMHLTGWPPELVDELKGRGFRVIMFDNRDVGRSSRIDTPPPGNLEMLLGRVKPHHYDLSDMAADAAALLDHLGIDAAHVMGMSMGGMIAQTFAARHPARTLSLASVFSTTGAKKAGQPTFRAKLKLMRPPAKTREEAVERYLGMVRFIGGKTWAVDEGRAAEYAAGAWDRGGENPHEGVARQIMAILKSGDRTEELRAITAPTVVIHGDKDPLVQPSGGHATAAAIPGAELEIIEGMGHDLAIGLSPRLAELVARNAARARAGARDPAHAAQ
ncbi:alpha/beta fold hydrolase [Rhodovulum sp. DZ06]|uniref:alpha/beta fold hydrolase n=1 Tax=Rhodovulum sp. DZ06 TaxID=3425126 RepID=UPI003D339BBA